ncbi:Type III restriction enzyme, res subunit [Nitrosomonas aestuarii]|uniref:Type III restriction enzyme, res subunit n=1 Tax=Nitrosomonas aestuarii TaxID=52441 RepID=A0A1I4B9N1_9PROT|nr:Z1 domain-containing protein [Nitrosomonas aestuarii]SFK64847.1 Type III restriction enzyme, res subunit [Nitrosomonas aestuarii]
MHESKKINDVKKILSQDIVVLGDKMTSKDIFDVIEQYRPVLEARFGFSNDDFEHLQRVLETEYVTTMGAGVSLIDPEDVHDEKWLTRREIDWNYWNDYESYLIGENWPTRVVSSMDTITNKILGLLKDPEEEGEWYRRGLVLGHVQSGKTANYIGLISKAADTGYKFIIVIAGIHNNLRKQTQERVDEGFIGRDSTTKEFKGVGLISPKRGMPVTVTTTESDFNKALAKSFGMELKSLNNKFILVIKKNVHTLSALYNWLKKLNTREGLEKITDIPMLLIDDEADNASINTNKPELDPTRTNKEIRAILNLFRKRCYVGYTATPFANIFVNPDDADEMLGDNLFPKDFIYCLDAPTNYFGSEKIFLNDENSEKFIIEIDDCEGHIPLRHKNGDPVLEIPPTLKEAIRLFILSRAIRNLRGQEKKHASMMINMSRFVATQRDVKQLVELYLDEISKAIKFNYKLPIANAEKDLFIRQFKEDFRKEYSDAGLSWETVLKELNDAAQAVKTFLVNGKSDETLDYSAYEKEGDALTAVAIGGLSMSRGLTVEGLTISYIYRNSKMYDTLMQMGRWFGYRDNYEDLCRVYMSDVSKGWYSHISEATEELRAQIKRMIREGKKPSDFGLYVRAHPDTLIVTALNKMRFAKNKSFQVSYDGQLKETHILSNDERLHDKNRELLNSFFQKLISREEPYIDSTGSYLFRDISWETIQEIVLKFKFHKSLYDLDELIPDYIKKVSDILPNWDVSFKNPEGKQPEGSEILASQIRDIGYKETGKPKKPEYAPGWYTGNKQRFSGNSMFAIGLDDDQKEYAQKLAEDADRKNPIFSDFTNARTKPILMFHLLDLIDKKNNEEVILKRAPALSVSFPNSTDFRTVDYTVGPVWLKQFEQERCDSPGEEDDYDPEQ